MCWLRKRVWKSFFVDENSWGADGKSSVYGYDISDYFAERRSGDKIWGRKGIYSSFGLYVLLPGNKQITAYALKDTTVYYVPLPLTWSCVLAFYPAAGPLFFWKCFSRTLLPETRRAYSQFSSFACWLPERRFGLYALSSDKEGRTFLYLRAGYTKEELAQFFIQF